MDAAKFSSFLVKVASRCNLDCDYCYVYHHADQSWRSMPKFLCAEHREAFADRLAEYILHSDLKHCAVILHGGEPLLAGVQVLADFAFLLRQKCSIPVDVSLQTNGLLLTEQALETLAAADIGVSLSLDGPRGANDKHRLTRKGRSSFEATEQALIRLQRYPSIFAGVIAVVDASTSAQELFEYFNQFTIPRLDFLLPDAHWLRPPPGRNQDSGLYEQWLVNAFDVWFDHYAHIPLRTFEALLDVSAGLPSGTDAFGFGDVSLLSIETDGSYHDLDVLKVTQDGITRLAGTVIDTPIAEVAQSAAIAQHRRYLRKEGLSQTCQSCEIVDICGGGSLPHRFSEDGFINPTVYCNEMKRLVAHISYRLNEHLQNADEIIFADLPQSFDLAEFELAETAAHHLNELCEDAKSNAVKHMHEALQLFANDASAIELLSLPDSLLERAAVLPGSIAWSNAALAQHRGHTLLAVDGQPISFDTQYLTQVLSLIQQTVPASDLKVGHEDEWLRAPFGKSIYFESSELTQAGRELVQRAMEIVRAWRPALATEILKACRAVQFVRDPSADPRKIVSFSDNSVPGALYVSISQGNHLIDPYDLADSLIHEHRHQKLYLLERFTPTVERTNAQVVSPWREDLRPPSGLLHAVFVFVELRRFWMHVRDHGPAELNSRAVNQLADTDLHLSQAFVTLQECPLTEMGQRLVGVLNRAAIEEQEQYELDHSNSAVQALN
ncbi:MULTISPECIES: cyclophane-forming radical SAM/SPASM peptide maturase YhhB [unclassified Pseudomonas]|uniref:cyclophane-forming radical SAM/SPASM peptide maturase YhhB n=1 Tax=unclassified Pseudomonas TaxID=196821 RepID=UPI000C8806FA|nr:MULTISPECIES: cyclophane-forming radical SAM/SPASM peptide maturase YhhB [unclassified Pseudomonas]PNA00047.1 FxsB family radical SAM/SPASM domain protein [Pseudomonas sp. FW305-42]PNA24294.1 FxsB family radical SAM/SPASM domain protein [Pseudomonas sp. MPR-R1B]PNB24914.1 FxsB family radical SAM/SPASM domain protein [Pseudomonas sp. DP16D-E2]PNB42976.1 FxsB family radical SAM/SPASM domain protein [Pseudomonas sp. FW305-17]PNB63366.1 FxsB family radical SAM/SPASM domain protein [Pseudomonas 